MLHIQYSNPVARESKRTIAEVNASDPLKK